eukprot:s2691_g4.t1
MVKLQLWECSGATCLDLARDQGDKAMMSALERLLKPKGLNAQELAETGSAAFKKRDVTVNSKDPSKILKQYGAGMFWLMCVSITVVEYLLDTRPIIYDLTPNLAIFFEVGTAICLALFFFIALGDPGKVHVLPGRTPGLEAYLGLLRQGYSVDAARLCTTTWLLKDDLRTKFDVMTGACIQEFDHFCNFTGCAIGRGNHRSFLLLATIEPCTQLCFLAMCVAVAYRPVGMPQDTDQFFWLPYNMALHMPTAAWQYPFMALVSILNIATVPMVVYLWMTQILMISMNWTVNEHINCARYSHFWVFDTYGNRREESTAYKEEYYNIDEEEHLDARTAKGIKAPDQPTAQERAEHELTHLPYRSPARPDTTTEPPKSKLRITKVTIQTKKGVEITAYTCDDATEQQTEKILLEPMVNNTEEFDKQKTIEGMKSEIESMKKQQVYMEVDINTLTPEQKKNIIQSRWVLRDKGNNVRARIVAKGYTESVNDLDDIYASTPIFCVLRTLLTICLNRGWIARTGDISTAFLHATAATADLYMYPPKEFYRPEDNITWKLLKAIYGLRSSPKAWQNHLAEVLQQLGLQRSTAEPNIFMTPTRDCYILVYVDDLLFLGEQQVVDKIFAAIQQHLLLRPTGALEPGKTVSFLGRNITNNGDSYDISLSQDYVVNILEKNNMLNCNPAPAPGTSALKTPTADHEQPLSADEHAAYRRTVGDLDANWIESMNSVMDDNRLLTLPSNERIPLKVHMKMIFEIRDLNYATPATATRAGIVCMDDTFGVQWRSYVKSWIKKQEHPDNIKDQLWNFFEKCGASTTHWMLKNVKILVPMVDICLISACCSLLDNLLSPATYDSLEYWFMFCFTAACGLCLAEVDGVDYRKNFSNWWKGEMKSVKYPSKGGIFDYYVKDAKFEEWSTAVETLEYSSETPMGEVTVTTNETYAMSYLMKALIEQHHPVMLIGLAGCGKTQSCLGLLKSLPPDVFTYYAMNMSYYTDSTLLQTMMENPLEKKAGKLYAPPGKLQLIYFVDDLNMPALDKYNTQSAIELMKQKQDYGHWYDRQKILVKDIGNTQYLCCMNPTAGSFIVNQRLQRHFWCCAVPFPEQSALLTIYSTFMKGHFERLPFKGPVQEQVSGIIKAALSLHSMVVSNFRKTASNFHYEFNIRHMSGVFSGLLQAKPGEFAEAEKVVLLWIHESERIYGDRLVSPTDLKKYRALAADLSKKMFGKFNFAKYFQEKNPEPLVFAPFSKGIQEMDGGGFYDKIPSTERLSQLLGEALREYNENNAAMDLVLFNDAMCHVGKICRIITSTPGHPLLVGVGGSGRQSLSRLSSYTCLYQTMMIVISGSYGMNDLKADLQAMYTKAGVKDEGVLFLFTDGQITNEKFLVFINDLLASGDIADLYASDEKDAIRNGVRSGCKGAGIQDTPENLWSFFISRIRKNLHMSLCFSPVGDAMRNRARKFPALVNCTVIDWFQPWPMDALYNVGAKFLEPIEQLGPLD